MDDHFTLGDIQGYAVIEIQKTKFDLFEIPGISKKIEAYLTANNYPSLIIDLNRISYIDSTGFGFLISTKNAIEKHGNELIVICNVSAILHVIDILNMNRFLKVFGTAQEAAQYLSGRA